MFHVAIALGKYSAATSYGFLAALIIILSILSVIVLKKSVKKREVPEILSTAAKKNHTKELMILSLEKRSKTEYQVSLESVNRTISPVKFTRLIDISPEMRSETIARIDYASKVIDTILSLGNKPKKAAEELEKMGTVIYKNFIPRDLAQRLVYRYLVLEVEDVQIPWELMYSDGFFALKYAISRRIKSERAPEMHKQKKEKKKH